MRPRLAGGARADSSHLPAPLACAPLPPSRALAGKATGSISRRTGGHLSRPCLAHRTILLFLPPNPHGAAPAAHDGGAAVAVARFAAVSGPVWLAGSAPHLLDRPLLA